MIQGLHSNRILVLNNGIRQEGQQWGSEHAPEIDPFIANQLTVIKGAESIRFGAEAMGGVVLVEPAGLPREAGLHGQVNLAGSENGQAGIVSGMLNGGLKQLPGFGWRLQATGKKSGNIKTADYYLNNTGTKEFNFSGALGYASQHFDSELYFSRFNTEIGIFSGAHIGNMDDLLAHIDYGRPFETGYFDYKIGAPRQEINHSLLKLKSHFHLKNNGHLNFTYGLQQNNRKEFDLRRGDRKDLPSLDLALSTQTADLSLEQLNTSGWKKTLGLNALVQVNNNVPGTMVTPLIPNYDTYGTGAYLVIKRIKNFYELEGGIRYDHKYLDAAGYTSDKRFYGGTHSF
ncbi:MAG TPA: TonB-dependent receptor plug domain-containing protein, partial [Flavisolibacter sp.]|nr:TonB-dependent receptor plug domain-containing protein [Flavisolibacter sp.]